MLPTGIAFTEEEALDASAQTLVGETESVVADGVLAPLSRGFKSSSTV